LWLHNSSVRPACAILVLSAVAFGQLRGTGVVSGRVIEASNGDPVRKAIVTLTLQGAPPTWATARTDGSGRFRFDGLPTGKYGLRAAANGAGAAIYGANAAREVGEIISLGAGETREGLTLRFIHTGTIAGRVLNGDGDPLPGIAVSLLRVSRNLGERVLVNYRNSATDDRGEYRIPNLEPGQYYLRANPQNGRGGLSGLFAAQYYGGARESKDATVVNLRSGENLPGLDFRMHAEPGYRIHGRVTGVPDFGPPPKPPEGVARMNGGQANQVEVSVTPAGEGALPNSFGTSLFNPPDYSFDFGELIGGMYRIEARARTGGKTWAASQLIDSRQTANEMVLALAPAADIRGTLGIEGQTGQAPANVRVTVVRTGSRGENISAAPDAGGRFTLEQVPPGEFAVNVNPLPPGAFLKTASFGGKDVRFTRLSVEAGADPPPLNIVISMRSAKLEGRVEAGSGDSRRAGIVLAPTGALHTLLRFYYGAVTDDEGKFHLENLAPGKYKIFALEKMAPPDFRNPEAADQLDMLGEEIELMEGGTLEAHPKLIPVERAREALPAGVRQ
jgi:hypothetical protein